MFAVVLLARLNNNGRSFLLLPLCFEAELTFDSLWKLT